MKTLSEQEQSIRISIVENDKDFQRELRTLAEAITIIEDVELRLNTKKILKAEAKDRGVSVSVLKKKLNELLKSLYEIQSDSLNYCTNRQDEINIEVDEKIEVLEVTKEHYGLNLMQLLLFRETEEFRSKAEQVKIDRAIHNAKFKITPTQELDAIDDKYYSQLMDLFDWFNGILDHEDGVININKNAFSSEYEMIKEHNLTL